MVSGEVIINSSITTAMGGKITIAGPAKGMYLITGRDSSLESVVCDKGGVVVLRLNGNKLLVSLPFNGYISLKEHRIVSSIGPVTVDLNRLAKVTGILAGITNKSDTDSY